MSRHVELRLAPEPSAPREARLALDSLDHEIPEDVRDDLRLLVSELVTNSLRHAELSDQDHITLMVRVRAGRVRVEVSDPGPGFDESEIPAPSIFSPSGWGLFLVGEVADDWGIERGRETLVWFEIDLESRQSA